MIKYSFTTSTTQLARTPAPAPVPAPHVQGELIDYQACPLCGSKAMAPLRSADCSHHPRYSPELSRTMHWSRCAACGHVFRSGYYTDAALKVVFRGTNESQVVGHDLERQRYVSAQMIEKVLPYQSQGTWLDVGFGNASLLFTAQEYGFEPLGLDLRQQTVDELRKWGVSAHCQDVAQLELPRPASVVSMADVLEHMPFPKVGLGAAHRLLQPGGVLLISMPNRGSPVWKALDAAGANPYWGEIEHYHNFDRERLYALLAECGFEPVRYGISQRYRVCMEVVALKVPR